MPRFTFDVIDPDGQRRKVAVDKDTESIAREALQAKGFLIVAGKSPELSIRTEPDQPPAAAAPREPAMRVDIVGIRVPFEDVFFLCFKVLVANAILGAAIGVLWFFVRELMRVGAVTPP